VADCPGELSCRIQKRIRNGGQDYRFPQPAPAGGRGGGIQTPPPLLCRTPIFGAISKAYTTTSLNESLERSGDFSSLKGVKGFRSHGSHGSHGSHRVTRSRSVERCREMVPLASLVRWLRYGFAQVPIRSGYPEKRLALGTFSSNRTAQCNSFKGKIPEFGKLGLSRLVEGAGCSA
jgi:hypothetical protein